MQMENDGPRWPMQWVWLCLLSAMLLGVGVEAQQPAVTMGDFGDAPDQLFANYASVDPLQQANFPSALDLDEVPGYVIHHLPQDRVLLGEETTLEEDAKLVDKDEDDGWVPGSFKPCQPARFLLKVTLPEGTPQGPIYLNALFDWNHDGRWLSASDCPADITVLPPPASQGQQAAVPTGYLGTSVPEWGIQNLRLDLPPYELEPGFSGDILLPPMLTGALPGEMWVRFTITVEPVDEQAFAPFASGGAGWDGHGDFLYGESEDYFTCLVQDVQRPSGCPDDLPELSMAPGVVEEAPAPVELSDALPKTDLSLTKTVNNRQPNVGDIITYTIVVYNDGPDAASGVVVSEALPEGLMYRSSSAERGMYDPKNGAWNIGFMKAEESVHLQIEAEVAKSGSWTNTAAITTSETRDVDSIPGENDQTADDRDSVTVTVPPSANLMLNKSVDNANPALGDPVAFTITVVNGGPDPATNVTVREGLPAALGLTSASPSKGSFNGSVWDIGSLAASETATLHIVAAVLSGGQFANTAEVLTSDQRDPDSVPGNNRSGENDQSTVSLALLSDLALTKADDADPLIVGNSLTWTLIVTNLGPSGADNVTLTDPLPLSAGITFSQAIASQGACAIASGTVSCNLGTLAAGNSASVNVTVDVDTNVSVSNLTNTATVASDNADPNPSDNQASQFTDLGFPSLSLQKSPQSQMVVVGQDATFTLTVTNTGDVALTNVVVSDPLSPACNRTFTSLAAGQSQSYTCTTAVSADFTNVATVSGDDPNGDPVSDTSPDAVVDAINPSLALNKTPASQQVIINQNAIFTLTVTNTGDVALTNVVVSDPQVPACNRTIASLGAGQSQSYTCTTAVTSDFTNVATVSGDDPNGDPVSDTSPTAQVTMLFQADLSLSKNDSADPVLAGESLTWTIAVNNAGPIAASGVSFSDPLPVGVTLIGVTPSQGTCDATVTCALGTIPNGGSATVTIAVTANPTFSGTLVNTATVSSSVSDPNPLDNADTETTAINLSADLSVTKADSPDPVIAGQNLTWSILVSNAGPSTASNVTLTDLLPAGVTLVSATPSQGSCNAVVTCTLGTLTSNSSATVTLNVTVNAGFVGALSNTATTSSSAPDPNALNNSDTENTTVNAQADLSVIKTDNPDPVIAGDTLSWTITVSNAGPSNAANATIVDLLPAGVTLVSASPSQGNCDTAVICALGTVPVGGSATVGINVTVSSSFTGSLSNTATLTSSATDPNPSDNIATQTTAVLSEADLVITKVASADPALAGQNLTWTLTVSNAGPIASDATNVSVTDLLPAGVTLVSATPSQGSCNTSVVCALGMIANGASATITLVVQINPSFSGSLSNTASVSSSTTDPDPADNTVTRTVTVNAQADLSIAKADSPDPVVAGQSLTWTLSLSNAGPSTATSVLVTDALPAGVTLVSATPSQGTCSGGVSCSLGTLNPGSSATITLNVTVSSGVTGTLTNTASVTSNTLDLNAANNSDTENTTVNVQANLAISKTDSADPAAPGDTLTWTLTASNAGPSDATNVTVSDPLPADVTYVSAAPTQGTCDATVSCSLGTLVAGSTATVTITVTINSGFTGTLSNTATVSSPSPDPNGANNSDTETTSVVQQADLRITKTALNLTTADGRNFEGDTIRYTLTLTNLGPNTASSITVNDLVPSAMGFVSAAPSQGTYNSISGIWSVGTLANGASATLILTATIDDTGGTLFGQTINNVATISGSSLSDPNPANNTATAPLPVSGVVDAYCGNQASFGGQWINLSVVDNPDGTSTITVTLHLTNQGGGGQDVGWIRNTEVQVTFSGGDVGSVVSSSPVVPSTLFIGSQPSGYVSDHTYVIQMAAGWGTLNITGTTTREDCKPPNVGQSYTQNINH